MDSGVDPRRRAAESNRGGIREVRRGEDAGVDPRRGEARTAASSWRPRCGGTERGSWKREKGSCDPRGESTRGSQLFREETRAWPSGAGANVAVCLGEAEEAASGGRRPRRSSARDRGRDVPAPMLAAGSAFRRADARRRDPSRRWTPTRVDTRSRRREGGGREGSVHVHAISAAPRRGRREGSVHARSRRGCPQGMR